MLAALDLLRKAKEGELQLHLPAICLAEARHPLSTKFQPRPAADRVRQFVTWAVSMQQLAPEQAETVRRGVDLMENVVRNDLQNMETTLRKFSESPGLEVFPLTASILTRSTEFCFELPELKPYDQAVLAAVLIRADELLKAGERELVFCELDTDLQPWDKNGDSKPKLTELYDRANVWVYGDFLMQKPEMQPNWHYRS